jgi:hypothetical protein
MPGLAARGTQESPAISFTALALVKAYASIFSPRISRICTSSFHPPSGSGMILAQFQAALERESEGMNGVVERIFIASEGEMAMQQVDEVEAIAHGGLRGDRYFKSTGYWSGVDECEVTLIEAEDLEEIQRTTGLHVNYGEHRRNIITRGLRLESLAGRRFQIGEAILEYDRPRPPCGYIQSITEPGMTKALFGRSGICARVLKSGVIRPKDAIVIL